MDFENRKLESIEMTYVPNAVSEFKNSKYYTIPSVIKKYQGFMPNAEPLEDKTFRGEPIYHKSDLTELHTTERWKKHGR